MVTEVMASSVWLTTTSALSPGTNILSCSRLPLSRLTHGRLLPGEHTLLDAQGAVLLAVLDDAVVDDRGVVDLQHGLRAPFRRPDRSARLRSRWAPAGARRSAGCREISTRDEEVCSPHSFLNRARIFLCMGLFSLVKILEMLGFMQSRGRRPTLEVPPAGFIQVCASYSTPGPVRQG